MWQARSLKYDGVVQCTVCFHRLLVRSPVAWTSKRVESWPYRNINKKMNLAVFISANFVVLRCAQTRIQCPIPSLPHVSRCPAIPCLVLWIHWCCENWIDLLGSLWFCIASARISLPAPHVRLVFGDGCLPMNARKPHVQGILSNQDRGWLLVWREQVESHHGRAHKEKADSFETSSVGWAGWQQRKGGLRGVARQDALRQLFGR